MTLRPITETIANLQREAIRKHLATMLDDDERLIITTAEDLNHYVNTAPTLIGAMIANGQLHTRWRNVAGAITKVIEAAP